MIENYENDLREYNRGLNQSEINANAFNKKMNQYEEEIRYLTKQND